MGFAGKGRARGTVARVSERQPKTVHKLVVERKRSRRHEGNTTAERWAILYTSFFLVHMVDAFARTVARVHDDGATLTPS